MCLDNYYIILLLGTFIFALFETFIYLLQIIWPTGVYFLLFWLVFWLVIIFWDFVMIFTVFIGVPLLNLGLAIGVFILNLLIIFYIIESTVWNAIVPFLGMLLKLFLDLILGILTQVFQLLGSIDLQPFFDALAEILPPIVEIVITVLQVLIEVGSEVVKVLVIVVRPLIQIFLDILKTVIQIVTWLVKPLFDILEPILYFIGWLFGSTDTGGSQAATSYAGRKLLSLGLSVMLGFNSTITDDMAGTLPNDTFETVLSNFTDYGGDFYNLTREDQMLVARYHLFLKENLEPGGGGDNAHKKNDITQELLRAAQQAEQFDNKNRAYNRDDYELVDGRIREKRTNAFDTGRRTLSSKIDVRGESIDGDDEDDFKFNVGSSKLDDLSHTTAYAWHRGIKTLRSDDWTNAMETYNHIRALQAGKQENNHLSQKNLRYNYRQTIGAKYRVPYEKSLANVKYTEPPEDPFDVAIRLEKEKEQVVSNFARSPREFSNSGRQLLAIPTQWSEAQKRHINKIEVDNARKVMEAQERYVDYYYTRYKISDSVYNGITTTLREYAQNEFHPNTFSQWWSDALDYYGYTDIWHVRQDFLDTHQNTSNFMKKLSANLDNPILNYIRSLNEDNSQQTTNAENQFFSNWEQAEQNRQASGRRLHQYEAPTNPALDSFAMLSTKSCFTKNPANRNALCQPEWPQGKMVKMVSVKLSDATKAAILTSSYYCSPWKENKALFAINADNLFNFFQEIRFLLSAFPFFNYNIASLTLIAPWTGWFLDWIFLVPKFQKPTAFQIVCAVRHLYDLFIVGVFLFFIIKFVFPIVARIYRVLVVQWNQWNQSRLLYEEAVERGQAQLTRQEIIELEERLEKIENKLWEKSFVADDIDTPKSTKITKNKKKKKISNNLYLNLVQQHNGTNFNERRAIEHMQRLQFNQ
jgi:hypothetical protein